MWAATGLSWAFTGCSPKCLDPGGLHVLDALLKGLCPPLTIALLLLSLPHVPSRAGPPHKASLSLSSMATADSALSGYSPCFLLCPTLSQL